MSEENVDPIHPDALKLIEMGKAANRQEAEAMLAKFPDILKKTGEPEPFVPAPDDAPDPGVEDDEDIEVDDDVEGDDEDDDEDA